MRKCQIKESNIKQQRGNHEGKWKTPTTEEDADGNDDDDDDDDDDDNNNNDCQAGPSKLLLVIIKQGLVHGLEVSTDPRKFATRHPTCELYTQNHPSRSPNGRKF